MAFAARSALLPQCAAQSEASLTHMARSCDRVFLTGYIQAKTDTSGKQLHPYPIPRCILKILKERSTFTFRQPTRWVGKSTSLCQPTIPHSTIVILFYFCGCIWEREFKWVSERHTEQMWKSANIQQTTFLCSKCINQLNHLTNPNTCKNSHCCGEWHTVLHRVITTWNSIPHQVIRASSKIWFKKTDTITHYGTAGTVNRHEHRHRHMHTTPR